MQHFFRDSFCSLTSGFSAVPLSQAGSNSCSIYDQKVVFVVDMEIVLLRLCCIINVLNVPHYQYLCNSHSVLDKDAAKCETPRSSAVISPVTFSRFPSYLVANRVRRNYKHRLCAQKSQGLYWSVKWAWHQCNLDLCIAQSMLWNGL